MYHVGAAGRLRLGEAFHAEHDDHAARTAGLLRAPGEAAELWQGGRLVGRFSPGGAFAKGR